VLPGLLDADRALTTWIAAQFASPIWQWGLLPFTAIGYAGSVWMAIAALLWPAAPFLGLDRAGRRRVSASHFRMALWRAVLAVLLAGLFVDHVAKPLVRRDRPYVVGPKASAVVWIPTTTSFPSGHAATAGAGALALAIAWPAASLPLALLAFLVILSRVALGVHFLSDVVAGALVGASIAAFITGLRTPWWKPPSLPG
jgi:membrane-associated phospholipid phosphatase